MNTTSHSSSSSLEGFTFLAAVLSLASVAWFVASSLIA